MLLKPFSYARNRSFVGIGRGVRTMKDANLFKQDNSYTTSFALANLCAQFPKQAFNVAPFDIGTRWMREDCIERALTFALHSKMVLRNGTILRVQFVSDD